MDYLLSLVGKDEETILDAMKEMVENVDKVKNEDVEKNCELESHFGGNFACKECCKTFGSRDDRKTHKRIVHAMHRMKMRLHELEIRILDTAGLDNDK